MCQKLQTSKIIFGTSFAKRKVMLNFALPISIGLLLWQLLNRRNILLKDTQIIFLRLNFFNLFLLSMGLFALSLTEIVFLYLVELLIIFFTWNGLHLLIDNLNLTLDSLICLTFALHIPLPLHFRVLYFLHKLLLNVP